MAAPRAGTEQRLDWTSLGPPVRPAAGRICVRGLATQGGARRMLLSPLARELAQPDGGQLQRQLLGRPGFSRVVSPGVRLGLAADRRALPRPRLDRHALPRIPEQQEQFQGRTAGRAGRRPGCWTSRPTSRITGPCATSRGPSTRGSTRPGQGQSKASRGCRRSELSTPGLPHR